MSGFEKQGYELIHNAISEETAKLLSIQFNMHRDNVYLSNNVPLDIIGFNSDALVEKSFCWYSSYGFESLLKMMLCKVECVVGKSLYPTYTYARIYYNGAEMAPHIDRPFCEYSATMTIEVEEGKEPWEIWIRNLNGEASAITIPVGSMVVYRGNILEHWRNTYTGNKQIQVFLHYVDVNGQYADHKFDKREMLGRPLKQRIDFNEYQRLSDGTEETTIIRGMEG